MEDCDGKGKLFLFSAAMCQVLKAVKTGSVKDCPRSMLDEDQLELIDKGTIKTNIFPVYILLNNILLNNRHALTFISEHDLIASL